MARPFFPPLYPSGDIYPSATMTFPMQEDTSLRRFRWQHTCQDSWWHISTRTCKHLRRARGKGDKDTYRPLRLVLISPVQLIKLQLKPSYSSFKFICFMSHWVDKVKPFICRIQLKRRKKISASNMLYAWPPNYWSSADILVIAYATSCVNPIFSPPTVADILTKTKKHNYV